MRTSLNLIGCILIILSVKPLPNIKFKLQTEEASGLPIFWDGKKRHFPSEK